MPLILESLVTTQSADGVVNLAPMGPVVDEALTTFTLRPFTSSQTYRNLRETRCGVIHVTDDVRLLAAAALNRLVDLPPLRPAETIAGQVLVDCCRWFEVRVVSIDDRQPRTEIRTEVVAEGHGRAFWGWNRARHAVLEATILATRWELIPADELQADLRRLQTIVEKTAGPLEWEAWDVVEAFLKERGVVNDE